MVGAATVVCEVARDMFGVVHGTVFLTCAERPIASIDNMLDDRDDYRRAWFGASWDVAPLFHELLVHHAPVGEEAVGHRLVMRNAREAGYTGPDVHTLLLPLLARDGVRGAIRFCSESRFTKTERRDLAVLGNYASVHLAHHLGADSTLDSPFEQLTPKQFAVVELVRQGSDNEDICKTLRITIDTVKKHLKDVRTKLQAVGFGRPNRDELANLAAEHLARRVPRGITRNNRVVIARP